MGDGFWSRPPAPNFVSPGIIKRPHIESDVNISREPLTISMIHYVPKSDALIGLNAANVKKSSSPRHAVSNLARAGLAMEAQFPGDGSKTLLVEGLPPDCQEQEVSRIFRSFDGFEKVRLVNEDPEKVRVFFVDFVNATCAVAALTALQGYKAEPSDPASPSLRLTRQINLHEA